MTTPTIFIVDDDVGVLDSLSLLLGLHGYQTALFVRAQDFLDAVTPDTHGCALIDMRMDDVGGLEIQYRLKESGIALPVILMSGYGNIAAARVAFKAGALDFLNKPISEQELLESVHQALSDSHLPDRSARDAMAAARVRIGQLSGREREVLELLATGLTSRDVAAQLKIAPRTVETYKRRMLERLGAHHLSELIQLHALSSA